ncbi:hypothetical protein R3W88_003373 [Solanum pinnatisectum]|uniref:Uncharacterized protein n=1 Tax=Solanum pinnatisectum TaxID=50273 RepID=A0AAV9MNU7_9SOLN|nr:hypothetical protein R3W88_003373 [Solanum pinnatisectum]
MQSTYGEHPWHTRIGNLNIFDTRYFGICDDYIHVLLLRLSLWSSSATNCVLTPLVSLEITYGLTFFLFFLLGHAFVGCMEALDAEHYLQEIGAQEGPKLVEHPNLATSIQYGISSLPVSSHF